VWPIHLLPYPPLGHRVPWAPELPPVGQLFSRWGPALTLLLNLNAALVKVTSGPRLGHMSYLTQ